MVKSEVLDLGTKLVHKGAGEDYQASGEELDLLTCSK